MSKTATDLPKVSQLLDAGWVVMVFKNDWGSYSATAKHDRIDIWERARDLWVAGVKEAWKNEDASPEDVNAIAHQTWEQGGVVDTDDFTPEQALTRLAYKVHGQTPPDKEPPHA